MTVQRAGEERRGRAGPLDVLDSTRVKEFGVASIVEFEELELSGDVDFFFFVVVVVSANVSRTPQNNFAIGITDGQMLPVWRKGYARYVARSDIAPLERLFVFDVAVVSSFENVDDGFVGAAESE